MVQAGVDALQDKAVSAVRTSLWGAMSYMAPRMTWSNYGSLGFKSSKPESTVPVEAKRMVQLPSFQAENVPPQAL